MTQQVNLYQPILRREKKVFSAGTMAQLLGAVAVIMLLLFAFSRWQLERLQDQRAELRIQERELTSRFTEISRSLQAHPESAELRLQVERSTRELDVKRRLLAMMQDRPAGEPAGFSEAFAGLARQRVTGLWLTGIELHRGDERHDVTLRGRAARAELVPQLVQRLGEEAAFQGVRFLHMRVFQSDAGATNALEFELTTLPAEEERQ